MVCLFEWFVCLNVLFVVYNFAYLIRHILFEFFVYNLCLRHANRLSLAGALEMPGF